MNNMVLVYGLTKEQLALLETAMPDGYEVVAAECMTDMIVTNAVSSIVDSERLNEDVLRTLLCYYMDMGDRLDETVVWLGNARLPESLSFTRYDSFLDFLMELNSVMEQAKSRYDTMQMYGGEYAFLPKHAIEESMEADVYAALYRKYGNDPGRQIIRQVRREWMVVLEAGVAEELAAMYELTRWLKRNGHCYRVDCETEFRFILFLLDILKENPLPLRPSGYDPLRQKNRLQASYIFHLPEALRLSIRQWRKHHWLNSDDDTPTQLLNLGNIRFEFCRL